MIYFPARSRYQKSTPVGYRVYLGPRYSFRPEKNTSVDRKRLNILHEVRLVSRIW